MKLRETTVYVPGHDVGLRSACKLRFLSNGPYSRHEVTTDFLAAIFARISAIRARNGVNRARKRGAITCNTVEIPRVLARSRAHFHPGPYTFHETFTCKDTSLIYCSKCDIQYASKKTCHTVVTKDRLYGALLQKNGRATVRQRSTPLYAAAGGTV